MPNNLLQRELKSVQRLWRNLLSSKVLPAVYLRPPPQKTAKSWALMPQGRSVYRCVVGVDPNNLPQTNPESVKWLWSNLQSSKIPSGKCRSVVQGGPERSWSTKGGNGPHGPPGPLRSALIHTFRNFTENVDQGGSGWTRRTRGTINPLGGPGVVFTFC